MLPKRRSFALLCVLLSSVLIAGLVVTSNQSLAAEQGGTRLYANPQTIRGLGTTAFPTSTKSPEAQTAFLRGLLLLHLFEYSQAAASFVAAEKIDPAFAMAYWGEAMTFNHGVWNQVDAAAGKAALDKFASASAEREARVGTAREKAYLAAVDILYDGSGSKVERDKRYSEAMKALSANYPDDRNAQLFYALALLSQSEGVRDVPVYLHASEISKAIFRLEPNNPGAAHYWIHGMDDPEHAAGALEAARALSIIAPDAPHAQHMCSHIFMALGMWDDVVKANVEATRVSNVEDQGDGFPPNHCGHYAEWLEYGLFQQGRILAAQQSVRDCERTDADARAWVGAHPGEPLYGSKDPARVYHHLAHGIANMRNMAMIESQDWNGGSKAGSDTSATATPSLTPEAAAWCDFTRGLAAAEAGNLLQARSSLQGMRAKTEQARSAPEADAEDLLALSVGLDELAGLIDVKAGDDEAGLTELRRGTKVYRSTAFAFGPPITIKPPEELLGEILLARGDAQGARLSFEECLQRAPQRAQALLGLARAEHLAGDAASAKKTYQTLLTIWHAADNGYPALEEVRKALSYKNADEIPRSASNQ